MKFLEKFKEYNLEKAGYLQLPVVVISPEIKKELDLGEAATNDEVLRMLCYKGFEEKLNKGIIKKEEANKYTEQCKHELETLEKLYFVDYVLLVYLVIRKAREMGFFIDFGRGCLNGDSYIQTSKEIKRLKDITLGDKVLTNSNTYKNVVKTFKYECKENLIRIKTWMGSHLESPLMTSDHKVFCVRNPFKSLKSSSYKRPTVIGITDDLLQDIFSQNKMEWVEAKTLKKGDYLVKSINTVEEKYNLNTLDLACYSDRFDSEYVYEYKQENQFIPARQLKYNRWIAQSEQFLYVLGFFVGDGWVDKSSQIGFAFHSEDNLSELKYIRSFWDSLGVEYSIRKQKKKKLIQLVVRSGIFKRLFSKLVPDKTKNKLIPQSYLRIGKKNLLSLFMGLLGSDGSFRDGKRASFDSINPLLIQQVKFIAEQLGFVCSITVRPAKGSNSKSFKLRIYNNRDKKEKQSFNHLRVGDFLFKRVRGIEKAKKLDGYVYDIEVENDHCYQTTDFIVHNSIGGSLVFWLLNITGDPVDPLKHGLFFSRFVSEFRAKSKVINGEIYLKADLVPDADLNLGVRRGEIIEWLKTIYPHRVCKILAIGTFAGKSLIKEVYKAVSNAPEHEAKFVADMIETKFGQVDDIEDTYEKSKEFKDWCDGNKEVYEIALRLRDLTHHTTVHASGYLICRNEISDTLPVQLDSNKDIVASYVMQDVPAIKLDLLGLTTSSIIKDVLDNIPEKLEEINLDDNLEIYNRFQDSKLLPYGLYQIGTECAYKVCDEIKPKNIWELSDVNALARPGALGFVKDYKDGTAKILHPAFEEIFKTTRNLCLYQEQMIQMLVALGFTPDEGETCRKIVGKKLREEVKKWKEKIYVKAKKNGFADEVADIAWKILDDSSNYSFNLAHAIEVSYLGALTTYLKYKYPLQWYTACLKSAKHFQKPLDEVSLIQRELEYFGIKLLAPDLIKSELDFKIEGNNIRFGLGTIKSCGEKAFEKLIQFRKPYSTKFECFQAAKQAGINVGLLSSLLMAGTLEPMFNESRLKLVLEAQLWNILTDKEKTLAVQKAEELKFDLVSIVKSLNTSVDEKNRPLIKDSRMETIRGRFKGYHEIYKNNSQYADLAYYFFEKLHIGYSYSHTLKQIFLKSEPTLVNVSEVKLLEDDDKIKLVGIVESCYLRKSKAGNRYLQVRLTDETGDLDCKLFKDRIEVCKEENGGNLPAEGEVVFVTGTKKQGNTVFLDSLAVQRHKIFTKLSELPEIPLEKIE